MKIILIGPRSLVKARFDSIVWNFLFPLQSLGHNTKLFDTTKYGDLELKNLINSFKPDLLFCILTGEEHFGYSEPWATIAEETKKGSVKTFNWFADDSWRWENWSSKVYQNFFACSTTEIDCVQKYKDLGYENIFYTNWHANPDLYSDLKVVKKFDISFIGSLYDDRAQKIQYLFDSGIEVNCFSGLSFEEMVWVMASSKISLSFSQNPNDPKKRPQSKQRPYEILAAGSFPLCEYNPSLLEDFKGALTFGNEISLEKFSRLLLEKPKYLKIAQEKMSRVFVENYTSQKRLSRIILNLEKL
jgi:spore maturation protein CgeB